MTTSVARLGAFRPGLLLVGGALVGFVLVQGLQGRQLAPRAARPSDVTVRLDPVGRMPTHENPTSPVVAGRTLLLVDQTGSVYAWDGTSSKAILTSATKPAGMTWVGGEAVLNVASNAAGTLVYVVFIARDVPKGIPKYSSPRPGADAWQVLYQYDFNGTALTNARAIAAFGVRSIGHTGGGLAVLPDDTVLFATGDSGDAGEDGRTYPGDGENHLSKILRIDPKDWSATIVARGVRNVQRLFVTSEGGAPRLDFVDIGGRVAEELNSIPVARLVEPGAVHHFGWGRTAADGNAREGLFYINTNGQPVAAAPSPERGFVQPIAEFRPEGATLAAGSGPVSSTRSFQTITSMFGELVSGAVYAVTGPLSAVGQNAFRVNLVDAQSNPVTVNGLAGTAHADPRFFLFPDGTAGLLIERTGDFYRLTEVPGTANPSASAAAAPAGPAAATARTANVKYTSDAMTVDGLLDEPAWSTADVLGDFRFPWGDADRGERSEVRLLWGPDAIYLGARMADQHVVASATAVGGMYGDDMFEMHIAPDAANPRYFFLYESNLNLVVNAQMRMSEPNGTNGWFRPWDTTGIERASTVQRSSDASGRAKGLWTVEMRIPFAALSPSKVQGPVALPNGWKPALPPINGASWKFNFARANHDTPGSTDSDYSLWSFAGSFAYGPGKPNMHFHDQNNFGVLTFGLRP